jgi:hypothetical protein
VSISVFLSHSRVDKQFVRRLARDLSNQGIKCWLDEVELNVGDHLIDTLTSVLKEVNYVALVLSPDSIIACGEHKGISSNRES